MSEKYGQWQTSECGHAAYKIEPDTDERLTYTITARDCQREISFPNDILVCATCGAEVEVYYPQKCTALDEEGRLVPLAK